MAARFHSDGGPRAAQNEAMWRGRGGGEDGLTARWSATAVSAIGGARLPRMAAISFDIYMVERCLCGHATFFILYCLFTIHDYYIILI